MNSMGYQTSEIRKPTSRISWKVVEHLVYLKQTQDEEKKDETCKVHLLFFLFFYNLFILHHLGNKTRIISAPFTIFNGGGT